jgi:hypothetical protein
MERTFQEVKYPMTGFYDIEWDNCYQVTAKQSFMGQLVINRFFYVCPEPYEGSLVSIANYFAGNQVVVFKAWQSDDLEYTSIIVNALFGERQSYEKVLSGVIGEDNGANMPAFFAAQFRIIPLNTRVRKGRKAFAGVTEAMIDGNDLNSAYAARFGSTAGQLYTVITAEGQDLLACLLSPANTKHTGNVITTALDADYVGWSTQSSRKIGRGV